jgi:hypothetical protein
MLHITKCVWLLSTAAVAKIHVAFVIEKWLYANMWRTTIKVYSDQTTSSFLMVIIGMWQRQLSTMKSSKWFECCI